MTQRCQWSDELLQVGRIQAFVQRLGKHRHISVFWRNYVYLRYCAKQNCDAPDFYYFVLHLLSIIFFKMGNRQLSTGLTNLKDLSEVRVPVGEHGIDAVDGILGLSWRSSLGFSLQYRQQNTGRSKQYRAVTKGSTLRASAF